MENEVSNQLPPLMTKEMFVYSKIGMALVSAQRVEFVVAKVLEHLAEFDSALYGITTSEFLEQSSRSNTAFKTLGQIFRLLKLNPTLVIEDELNSYLRKRNLFVHSFWITFLMTPSDENTRAAIEFCYDFGQHSQRVESFFKGFLYFLALRHVSDRDALDAEMKKCSDDFDYFLLSLKASNMRSLEGE